MFVAYIIRSQVDKSYYIGHSSDIHKRLEYHNLGLSKYTSKKIPWELVYIEIFQNKKEANHRELFLKKQRNRSFYTRLISTDSNQIHLIEREEF
ncbi:MAG: GIY-YIG nuclease family protein [Bacteroidota bacterium]|nr:excinuclease ABC subunit C [Odoribacter sp.]MDP3644573.1 GIY-YIG nuclease family protein [Bacteroidota bacterium]